MTIIFTNSKSLKIFSLLLLIFVLQNQKLLNAQQKYDEQWRPQYHFAPEKNWMNDVNGLVYFDGEYHLFYQHNPFGDKWGHMSWGHAISKDLVHWEHLPVALPEENGVMIFSGSAVVDWKNTSGFGEGNTPPLIAIYTGYRASDNRQFQCIAYSNDKGRTWKKYDRNPVLDLSLENFRDPYVFWHKESNKWIMVIALPLEHKVQFYGSQNLKEWKYLSDFGNIGAVKGIWECPTIFSLPGSDNETKWILEISVQDYSVAGGVGGQYFIGAFDGTKFILDTTHFNAVLADQKKFLENVNSEPALWIDYGRDHYACIAYSDIPKSDGRQIWIAWMNDWTYADAIPVSPWRGMATLPKQLELRKVNNITKLFQTPIKELEKLRTQHHHLENISIPELNKKIIESSIKRNTLEIEMVVELKDSSIFVLDVLKGTNEVTSIKYDSYKEILFLDRTNSGKDDFNNEFPGIYKAPVKLVNKKLKLHLFIDRSSIEIFANDGEYVLTCLLFPLKDSSEINLHSDSEVIINSFDAWELKSIWNR